MHVPRQAAARGNIVCPSFRPVRSAWQLTLRLRSRIVARHMQEFLP